MEIDKTWLAVGFIGHALGYARFVVQWLQRERVKKSVIPAAFWYFSFAGGITLLAYAIHRRDPVFIIGQGAGLFVYFRNLQFVWRDKRATAAGDTSAPD